MQCLEVSCAVRPIYGSLGFKGLKFSFSSSNVTSVQKCKNINLDLPPYVALVGETPNHECRVWRICKFRHSGWITSEGVKIRIHYKLEWMLLWYGTVTWKYRVRGRILKTCSLIRRHAQKSKGHVPGPHRTKEKLLMEADKGSAYWNVTILKNFKPEDIFFFSPNNQRQISRSLIISKREEHIVYKQWR
jgi:hypothetical protein